MALSARASALLASFPRHPYVGSARTMEYVFEKVGLPLFEPVIKFQQKYAGYELITMHHRLFPRLICGIIHHKPPTPTQNPLAKLQRLARRTVSHRYGEYRVENYHFRVRQDKDKWFFGCTDDWFEGVNYIDEDGNLYHLMGIYGSEPQQYASSMDKYIEMEAFKRTIFRIGHQWQSLCTMYKRDCHWDELVLQWQLMQDEDASDAVNQIWFSDYLWAEVRGNYIQWWNTPLLDEPRKQYLLRLKG